MVKHVFVEKVENGFIITSDDSKVFIAHSYYDISDIMRKIYKEED